MDCAVKALAVSMEEVMRGTGLGDGLVDDKDGREK